MTMRLKFSKQRFAGDRTYQPGEVADVEDELAGQLVADKSAAVTEEDVTVFTPTEAPQDPPKDPPKKDPKK